jgi:hypothetical protein
MAKRTKLPTIVMGRSMAGGASTEKDPKVTFELEAETGEIFEVSFSLRGILSTVMMAHHWTPLKEELEQVETQIKV